MTLALLFTLAGCSGDDGGTDAAPVDGPTTETGETAPTTETGSPFVAPSLSDVHAGLVDGFVLVQGADLIATTQRMADAGEALCADPTPKTLEAAQQAWKDVRGPWKALEVVRFGPAMELPYRISPKLDFWPARPDAVETYIAGEGGVTVEDADLMGGATRGLPALEYVWFDGDPLTALQADPRRCAYSAALAGDAHVLAQRYVDAWTDDWRARLVDPTSADDDAYTTDQEVLDEWVNRMAYTVEDIRYIRLGKPMGDEAGGTPQYDTIESPYAQVALRDVASILDGVELTFEGGDGQLGVEALLPPDDPIRGAFRTQLAIARDALLVVPEPLSMAVVDGRSQVVAVQDALRDLQVVIQVDLAQALGVTIVFNDNDGD